MNEFEMAGYVEWFDGLNELSADGEWFTDVDWDCVEIDKVPMTVWDGCAATLCPLSSLPPATQVEVGEADWETPPVLYLVVDGWVTPLWNPEELRQIPA